MSKHTCELEIDEGNFAREWVADTSDVMEFEIDKSSVYIGAPGLTALFVVVYSHDSLCSFVYYCVCSPLAMYLPSAMYTWVHV